jgi:hypothetical protein
MKRFLLALLLALAVLPATAAHARPPAVVFDTDMDFDDAATLAYLAQEHRAGRIELRAITVTNSGAGLPGRAIRHARCLAERLGLSGVRIPTAPPPGRTPSPPTCAGSSTGC